jgi:hypothetical protein
MVFVSSHQNSRIFSQTTAYVCDAKHLKSHQHSRIFPQTTAYVCDAKNLKSHQHSRIFPQTSSYFCVHPWACGDLWVLTKTPAFFRKLLHIFLRARGLAAILGSIPRVIHASRHALMRRTRPRHNLGEFGDKFPIHLCDGRANSVKSPGLSRSPPGPGQF